MLRHAPTNAKLAADCSTLITENQGKAKMYHCLLTATRSHAPLPISPPHIPPTYIPARQLLQQLIILPYHYNQLVCSDPPLFLLSHSAAQLPATAASFPSCFPTSPVSAPCLSTPDHYSAPSPLVLTRTISLLSSLWLLLLLLLLPLELQPAYR